MIVLLEKYSGPAKGFFEIHQAVAVQISAEEALEQVNQWLLLEGKDELVTGEPTLVIGEKTLWRVPLYVRSVTGPQMDSVDVLDVDAVTGQFYPSTNGKALSTKIFVTDTRSSSPARVDQATEQHFKQRLLEAGLLTEIKSSSRQEEDFEPVSVAGKPLSELIIEDRR